jgi:hypothetical protein
MLGSLLLACAPATIQPGKPIHQFPAAAQLSAIAQSGQTADATQLDFQSGGEWEIAAQETSTSVEQAAAAALSAETAARLRAQPSTALDCVAVELARAIAVNGKLPGLSVRRFISGRCGAWLSHAAVNFWSMTPPAGVDAAQIEAHFRRMLAKLSPANIDARPGTQLGVGAARIQDHIVLVAAHGAPQVELATLSRVADAHGRVTVRGRVKQPVGELHAFVNRGAYAVAPCRLDPALAPPEFALSCELAPSDDHAWIQLLLTPPQRLIAAAVLDVLALRTPESARNYRQPVELEAAAVTTPAEFQTATLKLLNRVRAEAQLRPVTLAAAQSQITSAVTLPFFESAAASGDVADRTSTTIALGLLAGWSISDGTIQSADLVGGLSDATGDPGRWLSSALEAPVARAVLLDPHASTLALGVNLQPQGVAALAVTYRFTDPHLDSKERAIDVLARLKEVRDARKLGGTILITDTPGLEAALKRIRLQGQSPEHALQDVLEETANTIGRSVSGFVWETYELEGIEFPQELLRPGDLYVGAGLAQYRPRGGAWAQYALLFAVVSAER